MKKFNNRSTLLQHPPGVLNTIKDKAEMLTNTFCHLPGIGEKTEKRLWREGALSWDDFPRAPVGLSRAERGLLEERLVESKRRLEDEDPAYFAGVLPPALQWRLFPEFRSTTAYLDIETTGYHWPRGRITAISLFNGSHVKYYVRGENLEDFKTDILDYNVMVTYNGKCFDAPFIENELGAKLPGAHIDLMHVLRSLGYKGGLKGCEKALGIDRDELDGVDGFFAVLLWREYRKTRNPRALDTLLAYNALDAANLEVLMVEAYNRKVGETPFTETRTIERPSRPEIHLTPDPEVLEKVFHKYMSYRA